MFIVFTRVLEVCTPLGVPCSASTYLQERQSDRAVPIENAGSMTNIALLKECHVRIVLGL